MGYQIPGDDDDEEGGNNGDIFDPSINFGFKNNLENWLDVLVDTVIFYKNILGMGSIYLKTGKKEFPEENFPDPSYRNDFFKWTVMARMVINYLKLNKKKIAEIFDAIPHFFDVPDTPYNNMIFPRKKIEELCATIYPELKDDVKIPELHGDFDTIEILVGSCMLHPVYTIALYDVYKKYCNQGREEFSMSSWHPW